MAKSKRKSKGCPIDGNFTPLTHNLHDSKAYKDLGGNSVKLLLQMIRVARTNASTIGVRETEIQFNYTYSEAKRVIGISESTTNRCLKELWDKGFITVITIGGTTASDKCGRISSVYMLCDKWKSYSCGWTDRTKYEDNPWERRSEPRKNEKERCKS